MSDYPFGKKAVAASSGNVAAAIASASLPATPGVINYIAGFSVNGSGATAASVVLVTVTGLAAGTLTFPLAVAAGATASNQPILILFGSNPLPASSSNTAITVSCPSLGAGNTNNAVNVWGYQV